MAVQKELDHAAEAAQILHEDRISPAVQYATKWMANKLWVLYHAKDHTLAVLQLLDNSRLLRNPEQEEKDAEDHKSMLKAFGPARTPREKGYRALCLAAAEALPPSFREAIDALENVRTDEELEAVGRPSRLTVHSWRHAGSSEDALALNRVQILASKLWRRKTVPMDALREALGMPARDAQ